MSAKPMVLVTGATRGLGRSLVLGLVEANYEVVGTGRDPQPPNDWPRHPHLHYVSMALEDVASIHAAVRECKRSFGPFYGLINNAALGMGRVLATMHESEIQRLIAVNLTGSILVTKAVIRGMIARDEGRVINIASVVASKGFSGLSVYAATKGGLVSFTRSLAREVGRVGITVNCVSPGFMETEMTADLGEGEMARIRKRSPFRELADRNDLLAIVQFLLSEEARRFTGLDVTVDAGASL